MQANRSNRVVFTGFLFIVGIIYYKFNYLLYTEDREMAGFFSLILAAVGFIALLLILFNKRDIDNVDGLLFFTVITYLFSGILGSILAWVEVPLGYIRYGVSVNRFVYAVYIAAMLLLVLKTKKQNIGAWLKFGKIRYPLLLIPGIAFVICITLLTSYYLIPLYLAFFPGVYGYLSSTLYQPAAINSGYIVSVIINGGLLPAFSEEILYRGFLQSVMERAHFKTRRTKIIAITLAVSVLSGLLHGSVFSIISYLPVAFCFSLSVILTGSIFTSMLLNLAGNTFIEIFASIMANKLDTEITAVEVTPAASVVGSLVCLAICAAAVFAYWRMLKPLMSEAPAAPPA